MHARIDHPRRALSFHYLSFFLTYLSSFSSYSKILTSFRYFFAIYIIFILFILYIKNLFLISHNLIFTSVFFYLINFDNFCNFLKQISYITSLCLFKFLIVSINYIHLYILYSFCIIYLHKKIRLITLIEHTR